MKILANILPLVLLLGLFSGCNTVYKEQLENVKVGDKLIYRARKDGREWMWTEKITRIEGDTIYFVESKNEATSKNHPALDEFDPDAPEGSIKKQDLLKYTDLTGEDERVIIEIR